MKCLLPLSRHLASLGLVCVSLTAQAQVTNVISGDISENATWSDSCLLEGMTTIRSGVTIRVDPGTRLLFEDEALLVVEGTLQAEGTEEAPIQFTRVAEGARWQQLKFWGSDPSRLQHCLFEYADSAGSHLDYYDDDCDAGTPLPSRDYHEAIVIVGCEVTLEDCLFQNLPDDSGSGEGDALAVISDDPDLTQAASAVIRRCQFVGIGQGIHTRFSYVLVEDCYFTGHHGDNDDVDLYGESDPPPLIRANLFVDPDHDDMINPTRCSAVIVGNIISGSDDHGVVLRDQCSPILMNNLIMNCRNGGVAIQNQCDALIANNTIVNCGRGLRFFDHTGRWGPPYCLFPGSGRATVVNTIIWDCPTSMRLEDSPYPEDLGSHVMVRNSLIEGGLDGLSVSDNSTVDWGEGNLDRDPLLEADQRPTAESPVCDAGVDPAAIHAVLSAWADADLDGRARPLDGTGDGESAWDIGAYEFLLPGADSNDDGIPDEWCERHGFHPLDVEVADGNPDQDASANHAEWVADTDPHDPASVFSIDSIGYGTPILIRCQSSTNRLYSLWMRSNPASDWSAVEGQQAVVGNGALLELEDTTSTVEAYYHLQVQVPGTTDGF